MEITKFVKVNISLEGLAAEAVAFNIILFLTDVTKDEVRNWEPGQVVKSYGPGDIGNDFPSTSHPYKVSAAIFSQNPAVDAFWIGRRDPDQSVADALDVIENSNKGWFALVGLRGLNDILAAAAWIEAHDNKFMFTCSYDKDIITTSDQSIAAILDDSGYRQTTLFYNSQAGFTLPDADLTLTVLDGECSVIVSNGPQTEEVTVDALVENFTYTIDIDGEVAEYTTAENYNTQINKITVLRAIDAFTYRISIAGVVITYVATVPTDTEEDIKNQLKTLINADLVLQQKMTAVNDPEGDIASLHLIGQTENTAYEVLPGENLLNTPQTALTPPTQKEIAAALQQQLLANTVINDLVTVTLENGGESIIITIKDALESFVIAVSANLTNNTIVFDYGFQVGRPVTVIGAEVPLQLNGDNFISEVPAPNEFKFLTEAPDGVPTGTIDIEVDYNFPDARMAGMGLAFPNGSLDWAHQDIIGVIPETEEHLTNDVINNLEAHNVNFFHVTAGKRLLWEGRTVGGLYIDIVIDGIMYLPTRVEESIFNFITSLLKIPMSAGTMGSLKNAMDAVLEQEGKVRGITAPFIENKVRFPVTGFPPGARPGDHYVSRVPRVADIPLADRQNRKITSGVEFELQTSGGLHVIVIQGTLHQ